MSISTLDESRLEAFVGQVATEIGATLVTIGDRLGLYRAMADAQPVSAGELAARTETQERYVREWLNAQAASGFVAYDAADDRYTLPAEQAFVLADETSPLAMGRHVPGRRRGRRRPRARGGALAAVAGRHEREARARRTGGRRGLRPRRLHDPHGPGVPRLGLRRLRLPWRVDRDGRERAREADVEAATRFEAALAQDFPGDRYDLICFFDALHDMGDPVGAARRARRALADDGAGMIVEPFAEDSIEDNLTPVERMYYGFSTLVCTPGALSEPGGAALGTQAGEARLREVLLAGGFGSVRVAAALRSTSCSRPGHDPRGARPRARGAARRAARVP